MTSKCLVLEKAKVLKPYEFPLPEIKDDDGLLRVEACGLCGSDCSQYHGNIAARYIIPGHEIIGVIVKLGKKAQKLWNVSLGDRVAIEVFKSCRSCNECVNGSYLRCEKHGISTMYGFYGTKHKPSLWGGYSQYLYLDTDSVLLRVPSQIKDPVIASLFNPLGAGVRWGKTMAGTKKGDVVVILGPGIRGICCAVAAKMAGAKFVLVSGLGENDKLRLETALKFGADCIVDVEKENIEDVLRSKVNSLADIVIDVTSHAPGALAQSIQLVKAGGTIVIAAMRGGSTETPDFIPDMIVLKEIRIQGALGVDRPAYEEALSILASTLDVYPWLEMPRKVAGFNDMEKLLITMSGHGTEPAPIHGCFVPDTTPPNKL